MVLTFRQLNQGSKKKNPETDFHLHQHLTRAKMTQRCGERMDSSINNSELPACSEEKMILAQFTPPTKITSSWIIDINL